MASVVLQPPSTTSSSPLVVVVDAVAYTHEPGQPVHVPQQHYAGVQAQVAAAFGSVPTPAAPTVVPQGATGAGTVAYEVVASNGNGDGVPSAVTQITNSNAVLNNLVGWGAQPGVRNWKIVRTVGGATQGLIATVPGSQTSFLDTNLVASVYTPSAIAIGQGSAVAGPAEM